MLADSRPAKRQVSHGWAWRPHDGVGHSTIRRLNIVTHKKTITVILAAIAITLLVGLLYINFTGPEKKVETDIAHLYPVEDPQFLRSMGLLMGP